MSEWGREAAGGGRRKADTELKTKTPHVNVGKKGRQGVEKADAPSNTGTHVGRQWETMGSMGEKGRQDFVKVDTPSNTGTHVGRQWA